MVSYVANRARLHPLSDKLLETNKTSPTIEELEALVVIYGTTVFDLLSEAKGIKPNWDFTPNADIRLLLNYYESLDTERRKIALEFIQFLAEKQKMEKYTAEKQQSIPPQYPQ